MVHAVPHAACGLPLRIQGQAPTQLMYGFTLV
jgi:hypothetical protein